MKKIILLSALLFNLFELKAQTMTDIKSSIYDILNSAENVYMENGAYQRVTSFKYYDNDCLFTFWAFDSPIYPGTDEKAQNIGWVKYTIDFSSIKAVWSTTNLYGYKVIAFSSVYAGVGNPTIEEQFSIMGNYYHEDGTTEIKPNCTMPIDSPALLALFKEYKNICNKN